MMMANLRPIHTLAVVIVVAVAILQADAQQKKPREPRDVEQIRAVLNRQVEAWNRRDLEGFMVGYWRSPDLTFFSGGTRTGGWDATLERYKKTYQSEGREMGHLQFSELQIDLLGARSAVVRGHWQLEMASGRIGGLFTLLFRKFGDGWKIVHDHTGTSS